MLIALLLTPTGGKVTAILQPLNWLT